MNTNTMDIQLPLKRIIFIVLTIEMVFFILLLKSPSLGMFFLTVSGVLFFLYAYPEIGLAIAFTGNNIIYFAFDHLNISMRYPEVMSYMAILTLAACFYLFKNYADKDIRLGKLFSISIAIVVLLMIGVLYSSDRTYGMFKITFYFIYNLPLFVVASFYRYDFPGIEKILFFTLLIGIVLSYFSFQAAAESLFFKFMRFRLSDDVGPLNLSRGAALSIVSAFYFLVRFRSIALKLLVVAAMAFVVAPLVWTGSRAPLLGLLLTGILFYLLQPSQSLIRKISFFIVSFTGGVFVILRFAGHVATRMSTPVMEEASAAFRVLAWIQSLQDFASSPLLGIGTGSFYLETLFVPLIYPHNLILELMCENGIFGLVAILIFIGFCGVYGLKSIKAFYDSNNPQATQLSIVALCLFANSLWNAMFSGHISANFMVWFSAGLIWAMHSTYKYPKLA